jgi:hypothetical protein
LIRSHQELLQRRTSLCILQDLQLAHITWFQTSPKQTRQQNIKGCQTFLPRNKLASSTVPQTSITQTLPNVPYTHGRIIFLPTWQAFQNLSSLPTGAASQLNAIPHSTCYVHVVKIFSSQHTKRSFAHSYSASSRHSLHTPSILPTPPPPTPLVDVDKPIIIWNPQLVQPSLPIHNHNTDGISSNRNTSTILKDNSDDGSPIPSHSTRPPHHHHIRPLQNRPLTHNQLRLRTVHMINCIMAEKLMPTFTSHSSTFASLRICIHG